MRGDPADPRTVRNAVAVSFIANGALFASLATRLPDFRAALGLGNAELGTLLFCVAVGSVVALPAAGLLIEATSARTVVRAGSVLASFGVTGSALAAETGSVLYTGLAWGFYGVGVSIWDVAMNVEGAEAERRLGRTVMPRFHAGWSLGSLGGAGIGIAVAAAHVPLLAHLGVTVAVALAAAWLTAAGFAPVARQPVAAATRGPSAWREPRTVAIGVMVLAFAVVEGTANDWLTLALVDGYDAAHWVAVAGFTTYVAAMTTGRLVGPVLLDQLGRAPVLWACCLATAAGTCLTVYGHWWPIVAAGIVLWGLGASLGFPVGISAAADDPSRAAARVSVVSTIGYVAFLAGPPAFGHLGEAVGTLPAMLLVAALMGPAALTVAAVRSPRAAPR